MDSGGQTLWAADTSVVPSEVEYACFLEARARIRAMPRRDPQAMVAAILTERGQLVVALNTDHRQDWGEICAESGALAEALRADPHAEVRFSVAVDCNGMVSMPCDHCLELFAEYSPEVRIGLPDPDPNRMGFRVGTLPAIMAERARQRASLPMGIILAGGRGKRMGGDGDKALRPFGGQRLIDHVITRLRPQVATLAINANGNPARLAPLGLPVIADTMPDRPGPLAGVLAGLDHAAAQGVDFVVTAAADTPFLPVDLVARLQAAAGPTGLALAASPDARGDVRWHPTCGIWPVVLRESLRHALNEGQHRMTDWTRAHDARMALFESRPHDPFININTPDDLMRAEALLRGW